MRLACWSCYLCLLIGMLGCQVPELCTKSKILDGPYEDIWDASTEVIQKFYTIQHAQKNLGLIESQWKTELAAFQNAGYRYLATLKIEHYLEEDETSEPLEAEPDPVAARDWKYIIKMKVQREKNDTAVKTENPDTALWLPDGRDKAKERMYLQLIAAKLGSYTVWSCTRILEVPYEELWQFVLHLISTHYGLARQDKTHGRIEGVWQEDFAPSAAFRYRRQARVIIMHWSGSGSEGFTPISPDLDLQRPDRYVVKIRVRRQKQEEYLDYPQHGFKWTAAGYSGPKEKVLVDLIEKKFGSRPKSSGAN